MKKAKILISWMHVNEVIHYFVEGQKYNFHLRFKTKMQEGKMALERWQRHYIIFTPRLVGLLVKSVDLATIFVVVYYSSNTGKSTF